jgi:hypothetical protein
MLCALIQNSLVIGVCDFTEQQIQFFAPQFEQVIDVSNLITTPQIGWAFDGQNISGTNVSTKITRLAIRQRFTVTELLTVMTYVNANPASIVAMLMQNLNVATYVDLARPDTQAGIQMLVSLGLLTQLRATAILTTTPIAQELYQG